MQLLTKHKPIRSTQGSAAWDMPSTVTVTLWPGETVRIPLGIKLDMPKTMAAMLLSRSGLGTARDINIKQGVGLIDSDYKDELIAVLVNRSDNRYTITEGDRICQLMFTPVLDVDIGETLSDERQGGFGSTG